MVLTVAGTVLSCSKVIAKYFVPGGAAAVTAIDAATGPGTGL